MTNASAVILKTFQFKGDTYTIWTTQNAKGDHYVLIDSECAWDYDGKFIFAHDSYVRRRNIEGNSTTGTKIHGVSYKQNFELQLFEKEDHNNPVQIETVYWS